MAKVGIIMGSNSDMPVMVEAISIFHDFNIETEIDIVSAHRTPDKMIDYAKNAHLSGISVIIAGAGGAAHLPGMVASMSPLPVIGVPFVNQNHPNHFPLMVHQIRLLCHIHIHHHQVLKNFQQILHP